MSRKETTEKVTDAVTMYYIKKKYSVHKEFGVGRRGQRRLDLLCMNTKGTFIGVEVKSCRADYTTDSKWPEYLPYVDKLYIAIPEMPKDSPLYEQIQRDTKPHRVGIMMMKSTGKVVVTQPARTTKVKDDIMMKHLIKMAWRGGDSVRNIRRR